jgi:cell division protease FtsH
MAVLLGGRAAEHLIFGHLSTGAADDLTKVTDIARSMVMQYGMDANLGHVSLQPERPAYLQSIGPIPHDREYSEETAREIDCSVRNIIKDAFDLALAKLTRSRKLLEQGAALLLQKETLNEQDLKEFKASLEPAEGAVTPAKAGINPTMKTGN